VRSSARLEQALGFVPATPIHEGLPREAEWVKALYAEARG
jgi:hypothetical protein